MSVELVLKDHSLGIEINSLGTNVVPGDGFSYTEMYIIMPEIYGLL